MDEKYYALHLDDHSAPSCCSFDKIYIGTEETIKAVADNLEKKGDYERETALAIRSYFNGDHSATHHVAYTERKVLTPVIIKAEHESVWNQKEWTHLNTWRFPYKMKCDSAMIHQIVCEYNDEIYRCIRARFTNLCYYSDFGNEWIRLNKGFWGNSSVFEVSTVSGKDDFTLNNLLYVVEHYYKRNISSAMKDISLDKKIDLEVICDDIFGNG